VTRVLLIPDLPIERWPSMDRYASRLAHQLLRYAPDLDVMLAGEIAGLTVEGDGTPGRGGPGPDVRPALPGTWGAELQRYVQRYAVYPRRVRRERADVFHVLDHSYAHMLLARRTHPAVVTVHDLLPVITVQRRNADLRSRLRNWLLARVLRGLRRADAWIVATEWLRTELAAWLDRDDAIHVIPFGVDDAFFRPPEEERAVTRRRWGLPRGAFVVLHVGSVGPRKNLPIVIAAVHGLRQAGSDAWLLQVGGTLTSEQEADLRRRGIHRQVARVGEVHESELRKAYHAADVLLFPSHYEGFGFPVLEAMASGLPVVTSGAGGLGEVAGDAAVVVGGREVEPYVAALRRVAGSRHWRDQLVSRGRERARRFRWVEAARKTAEVYRTLA
jgi:glycosyltransferase involved in cell wall biosynthesis